MSTVSDLMAQNDNRKFIRKILRAVAFIARKEDAALPEKLTDEDGNLIELPEAFLPVGIVSPDGYVYGMDVEKDEIDGLGYAGHLRTDVLDAIRSITFTPLESFRRHMLELHYGQDLSGITPSESGEIVFDEVDLPIDEEYSLIIIGEDGRANDQWIMGRGYPLVKMGERAEETWAKEGAISKEITLDVFTDNDLGTPTRHYLAGTGVKNNAAELGFDSGSEDN